MKFENVKVYNFENALRGMRNPMNSWDKSDSWFGITNIYEVNMLDEVASKWVNKDFPNWEEQVYPINKKAEIAFERYVNWLLQEGTLEAGPEDTYLCAFIGPKDMELAQRLIRAGNEHRKFMRQIFVTVDITAPLYWYKEMDTYKVGTVTNSTSTMHKLASTPITLDCFEIDDLDKDYALWANRFNPVEIINYCERLRQKYNETNDKRYWKELIRWLPESWLQTRTWTGSYENIFSIVNQRKHHKLTEWSKSFINFAHDLPYSQDLIFLD